MNLTLRQLRVFESVASHLSYTRAAQSLFLTQPAVSMQVKQLESQLGVALFEQVGKTIYLTETGKEVLSYTSNINRQLDELEQLVNQRKGVKGGKLRISVATTANYFVPTLLAAFNRRYPEVVISLDVTNRQALLGQLNDNSVDLVIMGQPPAERDLEAWAFLENSLVVVAPPDHPLTTEKRIPLLRLQDETFLVRELGSGTRNAMERFFSERDIKLKTGMEVGSNEAIKQSVQAGLGLGLLSRDTVEMELTLNRLRILDIEHFPIVRDWYVVHRRGKRLSTAAQEFQNFMLVETRALLQREK
jgi:LysR family transcriptional regulator, low CO2-responsive transcriptional regulator